MTESERELQLPVIPGEGLSGIGLEGLDDSDLQPGRGDVERWSDFQEDHIEHRVRAAGVEHRGYPAQCEQLVQLGKQREAVEAG